MKKILNSWLYLKIKQLLITVNENQLLYTASIYGYAKVQQKHPLRAVKKNMAIKVIQNSVVTRTIVVVVKIISVHLLAAEMGLIYYYIRQRPHKKTIILNGFLRSPSVNMASLAAATVYMI